MDNIEQMNLIRRLEDNLRIANHIQHIEGFESKFSSVYNEICSILLDDDFYKTIWDEPTLSLAKQLFEQNVPGSPRFQDMIDIIRTRYGIAKRINDLFFAILDNQTDEDELENRLLVVCKLSAGTLNLRARLGDELHKLRTSKDTPSKKVSSCLKYLAETLGINFESEKIHLDECLKALGNREQMGMVNALLIDTQTNVGAVIPVHALIQPNTKVVKHLAPAQDDFKAAVDRAMQCLKKDNFLKPTDGVDFSLDITDVKYSGSSIALASAIAMWESDNSTTIDPYTAFSGDINIANGEYVVQGILGVPEKIQAALTYGCRRIFLPQENLRDVPKIGDNLIRIIPINKVDEAIVIIHRPGIRRQCEGLNVRKIAFLETFCQSKGWQLSNPEEVQAGCQFSIAPPNPPNLKVYIFDNGTHTPKDCDNKNLNELLLGLNKLDEMTTPIQSVNKTFSLQDAELRSKIKKDLEIMGPVERRQEKYCDYSWRFEDGKQTLWVKQYSSGKLVLQGHAGDLYKRILDIIISAYNLKYPQSKLSANSYLTEEEATTIKVNDNTAKTASTVFPYIGTDESGKGDYFGPLVAAGVYVDDKCALELSKYGVKDSKKLSDNKNLELAREVARICKGRFTIIEIPPERYNDLYDQFKREGKNLNSLLAWGHAKALEEILSKMPCEIAIADQFADESLIIGKLQEKGKRIRLIQMHKAEENIGVAAASILARARFLEKLTKLSKDHNINFHKGVSHEVILDARKFVDRYGKDALRQVAKLHFKTTNEVTT